jgi:hypothetical protein
VALSRTRGPRRVTVRLSARPLRSEPSGPALATQAALVSQAALGGRARCECGRRPDRPVDPARMVEPVQQCRARRSHTPACSQSPTPRPAVTPEQPSSRGRCRHAMPRTSTKTIALTANAIGYRRRPRPSGAVTGGITGSTAQTLVADVEHRRHDGLLAPACVPSAQCSPPDRLHVAPGRAPCLSWSQPPSARTTRSSFCREPGLPPRREAART